MLIAQCGGWDCFDERIKFRSCIGCPTRYRTRHFFNNFTTNEDLATKFEADYRHTLQTHSFSFLTQRTYSCSNFVTISSSVLELLKNFRVR